MSAVVFSPDRRYRYVLEREVPSSLFTHGGGLLCVIGLNPSTADETVDDPTIRRLRGFAERWGHSRLRMLNVYAFRSTDPDKLWEQEDPVGPDNDRHLRDGTADAARVLCAWGNNVKVERHSYVLTLLKDRALDVLRMTDMGRPQHPLYLPNDCQPVRWRTRGSHAE